MAHVGDAVDEASRRTNEGTNAMQTAPAILAARPTASAAIAYVRDYFDQREYDSHATICGCVPSREADHARDVLFIMDGEPRPARFTVWFEASDDGVRLYGEW